MNDLPIKHLNNSDNFKTNFTQISLHHYEPFNIHIPHKGKQITLTIQPENDYYKIIYFGGIVGAIRKLGSDWDLVKEEELEPGDLPLYAYKQGYDNDHEKLELHLFEINQIAGELENALRD